MLIEEIEEKITGNLGRKIVFYEKLDSTNSEAMQLAEKEDEGLVVLADSQERGRGRLGRAWMSPAGVNIYMSIILKPQTTPSDTNLITLMAAVACATALKKVTGVDVRIKWPNDLMASDKKLGGILTELKVYQDMAAFAVVGIGINLNMDTSILPAEIRKIATSVKNETGKIFSREGVAAELLNEMSRWYLAFRNRDRDAILSAWRSLSSTLGRQVAVVVGQDSFEGIAESIDDNGMLLLRLRSGEVKRINSGDLRMLR